MNDYEVAMLTLAPEPLSPPLVVLDEPQEKSPQIQLQKDMHHPQAQLPPAGACVTFAPLHSVTRA